MKKIIMLGMVLIVMCSFLLLPTSVFGASYSGSVSNLTSLKDKKYYLNKFSSNEVYLDFNVKFSVYIVYSANLTKEEYDVSYAEYTTFGLEHFVPQGGKLVAPTSVFMDKGGPSYENSVGKFAYSITFVFNSSFLLSSLDTTKNALSSDGVLFDHTAREVQNFIFPFYFNEDLLSFSNGVIAYPIQFHVVEHIFEYTFRFSHAYCARGFALSYGGLPLDNGLTLWSHAKSFPRSTSTKIAIDDEIMSNFESNKMYTLSFLFDNNAEVSFSKIKFTTVFNCPYWYLGNIGDFSIFSTFLKIEFLNFITESNVAENTGILGFNQNYIDCTWYDVPCHLGNALVYLLYNFPLTAGIFSLFKTIFGLISSTITLLTSFSGLGVLFVIFIIFFILRLARWLTG